MSRFNGGIFKPGEVQIEVTYSDGPLAHPSMVNMQAAGGLKVLMMGGLTKVEALAGQIASSMVQASLTSEGFYGFADAKSDRPEQLIPLGGVLPPLGSQDAEEFDHRVSVRSVNLAHAIIAECERRRAAAAAQPTE